MSSERIIVANHHMYTVGGSESFTYTFVKELAERGIEMDFFTLYPGYISDKLKPYARVVTQKELRSQYDTAIVSHTSTVDVLKRKAYKILQTCHGRVPALEQPSPYADLHVSVALHVKKRLQEKGYDSTLIYNGVDLKRFSPQTPINKNLKSVLSLSHEPYINDMIALACRHLGLSFVAINKYVNPEWEIEKYMNEADLVISLGRGCIEALACARNVLVYDHRPGTTGYGDGMLDDEKLITSLKANYTGLVYKKFFNVESIALEMLKYDHTQGERNRVFAEKHFDIKSAADKYLSLAEGYKYEPWLQWCYKKTLV